MAYEDEVPDGPRCPHCKKATGFKYVGKLEHGARKGETDLRGSCRFCGYVREGARA